MIKDLQLTLSLTQVRVALNVVEKYDTMARVRPEYSFVIILFNKDVWNMLDEDERTILQGYRWEPRTFNGQFAIARFTGDSVERV
jgi:hypothetical protein